MSAAENASLSPQQQAILSSAAAVDGEVAPVITHAADGTLIEQQADEQEAQDAAYSRNRDLLTMGIAALTPMLPFLPQCYTPQVIEQIAAAFTQVEKKRGWNLGDQMSPELMLAMATIPPSVTAFMLGRQYLAAKQAEKIAQKPESAFKDVVNDNQK